MAGGCGFGRACARLSLAFKAAREREGSAGCRWRAALKAGRGQRRGQVRGRACLSQRRRRGAPLMASRGAARGKGRAAAVMEWEGGSAGERAGEHSRPASSMGAAAQRGTEGAARQRAHARSSACARAQSRESARERGERKRVERERICQRFDSIQTQNFQLKLEKF